VETLQVEDSGALSASLAGLLTAIASLKTALEELPGPTIPGYYEALGLRLARWVPELHAAYDAYLAEVLITEGRRITCSKACSACCRHFVSSVEPFELIALDHHVKSRPDYADLIVSSYHKTGIYEKILQEEGDDEEADDRALYRYFLRGQACPFLARDGSCGVYEHRPMACRMFFAESSPRFCAGKALASPWNRNFQVELPQVAEEALARCSRLLESLELPEGLFPGMVAVNALFGRYDASPPDQASAG
jgi:Fe-S-cluster containining protein